MSASKSDLLFYSDNCQFSKQVIAQCLQYQLKDHFLFVCVDNIYDKLPAFVDRVPLIYRSRQNEIIYDDDIEKYISIIGGHNKANKPKESTPQQADAPQEILPFALSQSFNYSDSYSFLTGVESDGNMETQKMYTSIGLDDRMMAMPSNNTDDEAKNKFDAKMLDNYMQARDQDTAVFKQKMNNGMQPIVR